MRVDVLKNFITEVYGTTPSGTTEHCFLLILSARKKYLTPEENAKYNINNRYDCLKRKTIWWKTGKDLGTLITNAISEMSWEFNNSMDNIVVIDGVEIPRKAFVWYFTMNERDNTQAAIDYTKMVIDNLAENKPVSVHEAIFHSLLHKNPLQPKKFLDFDFDIKPGVDKLSLLPRVKDILGNTNYRVIGTHGGFHVLIDTITMDPMVKKTFYRDMLSFKNEQVEVEVKNDPMVPLPGTWQGNKIVEVLK